MTLNPEVARAAAQHAPSQPSEDRLTKVRDLVAQVRDTEEEKANLEGRLNDVHKLLNEFYYKDLPDVFEEAGVTSVSLPGEGNHPPIDAKLAPYYRANIAADWDELRRAEAFQWLEDNGHGDLIRFEVTVVFGKGEIDDANAAIDALKALGCRPTTRQSVPWSTLTAWLKEQVEKRGTVPPLETLGATIGRVVRIKRPA